MTIETKYKALLKSLGAMQGAAVAFSGGVDSTFLIAAAKEALGDRVLAVIGQSPTYPQREYQAAMQLATQLGVRYSVVKTDEISNPEFNANPPHRCFVCKTTLFNAIRIVADKEDLEYVLEGSNADDAGDYRPGIAAGKELGVRAPLMEARLTKNEIRALSREMGLPTWDKPSMACLSSRIPYGEKIDEPKLSRIERAEEAIRNMGIVQLRVRDYGPLARIEVDAEDISRLAEPEIREQLVKAVKQVGYQYVCLDLEGYRTGAMNEVLS
ncbi:MAG: ATP-dependent sacrificial sulfur transferase LarE [Proteobacteria bacterium]|nr:ATP-dependent sacrificial sulfur transferase LarE [Pseudomonadota bacterium]